MAEPKLNPSLIVLDRIDSTNSYALELIEEKKARSGMAVFAHHQTGGRGQRGKLWESEKNKNISLSFVYKPKTFSIYETIKLNIAIGLAAGNFFKKYAGEETRLKWPNDIYWGNFKAGGILIENKIKASKWLWSVIGIGINVNQAAFSKSSSNPISLFQISGKTFNPLNMASELYLEVENCILKLETDPFNIMLEQYNQMLYKKGQTVKLKQQNRIFEATILEVNASGKLIALCPLETEFNFGEIIWLL